MKRIALIMIIVLCGAMSVWASKNSKFETHALAEQLTTNIPFPNVGVVEIPHPEQYARVVAISDVHGMYDTVSKLLYSSRLMDEQGNWIAGKTLLLVVGDSIDKGPDSIKVLNMWINLTRSARVSGTGGAVIHLLGNHEAEWLGNPMNNKAVDFRVEMQKLGIQWEQIWNPGAKVPPDPRASYMRSMPVAVRVGAWLFCHAGLYPNNLDWPSFVELSRRTLQAGNYNDVFLTGDNSILEAMDWWQDVNVRQQLESNLTANRFYGVVYGHQDSSLGGPTNQIVAMDNYRLIKIDTGIKPDHTFAGEILVFTKPAQMNMMQAPEVIAMANINQMRPVISK